MGPPIEDVFMGPLVSQVHLEKVRSYVEIARKDGARILCGESVDELSLPAPYQKVFFLKYIYLFSFLRNCTFKFT